MLRLIVGVTFVYASIDKIHHTQQFAMSVRGYQILPVAVSNLFAVSVAWTEMIAGTMLVLGLFTRKAATAIGLLSVMFIAAISIVMVRGMVIDCGCFSAEGGAAVGPSLLVRNLLLLAATILIVCYDKGFLSLTGRPAPAET